MNAATLGDDIVKTSAVSVLASLSERKMLEFLKLFADKNTLALVESELIANGYGGKRYKNFKELLKDIEDEEDE